MPGWPSSQECLILASLLIRRRAVMLAGLFLLIALAMSVALVPRGADAGPPSDLDKLSELLPEVLPEGQVIGGFTSSLGESLTFDPPLRNRGKIIALIRADRRARGVSEEFDAAQAIGCFHTLSFFFTSTTNVVFGGGVSCSAVAQTIGGTALLKLNNSVIDLVGKTVSQKSWVLFSKSYTIPAVPLTYCASATTSARFATGISLMQVNNCGTSPGFTEVPTE